MRGLSVYRVINGVYPIAPVDYFIRNLISHRRLNRSSCGHVCARAHVCVLSRAAFVAVFSLSRCVRDLMTIFVTRGSFLLLQSRDDTIYMYRREISRRSSRDHKTRDARISTAPRCLFFDGAKMILSRPRSIHLSSFGAVFNADQIPRDAPRTPFIYSDRGLAVSFAP